MICIPFQPLSFQTTITAAPNRLLNKEFFWSSVVCLSSEPSAYTSSSFLLQCLPYKCHFSDFLRSWRIYIMKFPLTYYLAYGRGAVCVCVFFDVHTHATICQLTGSSKYQCMCVCGRAPSKVIKSSAMTTFYDFV